MTENVSKNEVLSPEWQEAIKTGINEAIDNYELFDRKLDFSPLAITNGLDERSWPELSPSERKYIESELFSIIGLEDEVASSYVITPPDGATWKGEGLAIVFKTKRSEKEDMYVHQITRPSAEDEYMVAPLDFRL